MSRKCDVCKKSITKTAVGTECSKCERLVHLSTKCAGLTNKQIAALKAADGLDWTCTECQDELPRRNSSVVVPEDDEEDEDDETVQISAKKLLSNISVEVHKAIKKEVRELQESLLYHTAKMDEVVECMEAFKRNIKDLERKNTALTNLNTNLEIRIGAMEQKVSELEQEKLNKFVEISNVSSETQEQAKQIVEKIADNLKQPKEGIKAVRRYKNLKDKPATIVVELKEEDLQEQWILAGRATKTVVADVHPTDKKNTSPVYIREAMTKSNKHLFWNTKQELKINQGFKYVWFKKGVIRARKDDNCKIMVIKNIEDLRAITSNKA